MSNIDILKKQIRRKVKRLLDIRKEAKEIKNELSCLIQQTNQKIETLNGCGTVLASRVLAEVRNIDRFRSSSSLAKYAGLCPRQRSSGKTKRHIKTKSGNRQLNMAMHRIALSQISKSGNQYAKKYFQRKKRKLVDIVFMMLKYKQEYSYSN
jgi:transposase